MSGRKQHFIPQSVLRAWGRKGKGDKLQVSAYTFDRGVFVAATDGLGAERDFYSELSLEADEETLDDKITAYETELANVLLEFRSLVDGESVDASKAAELITHLVVRNDHFRKATSSAAAMMFSNLAEELADETAAKTALGFGAESPSIKFNEVIGEFWEEHGTALETLGFTQDSLTRSSFEALRENFGVIYSDFRQPMLSALTRIATEAPKKAAEAQKRSLEESLAPPLRVEVLREFDWHVCSSAKPLILPDCVAVGLDGAENPLPLMFADKDTLSSVVMPLSPDSMLIGNRRHHSNLDCANECFVECSWDFFVAQEKNGEFERLRASLRRRIEPYLQETIRNAVAEAIRSEK